MLPLGFRAVRTVLDKEVIGQRKQEVPAGPVDHPGPEL